MGVLLVDNHPPHSGIGRYSFSLFSTLEKLLGENVEFFAWHNELFDRLHLKAGHLPLLRQLEMSLHTLSHLPFMLEIPRRYDLYHITSDSLSVLTRSVKPSVVTVHDVIPFTMPRSLKDFFIRKSAENLLYANKIICVSQNTKQELMRVLPVNPHITSVVYHGLDHNLFRERDRRHARKMLRLPQSKKLILNVGSEEPRKNIPTLIRAFYRLQKVLSDVILLRIGRRESQHVQRLIDSLGLGGKVLYVRTEELSLLYNAADLFVFPSIYEGFGMPPLEAMASRCPVIASNRTSIPEIVGDAGVLLDPFDVDGFAHWMREVLTREDMREELGRKGLERSMMFNWQKCAGETLQVYREVLGKS